MTPQQMQQGAEILLQAEAEHRRTTGSGNNTTIRNIASYLQQGLLSDAQAEWSHDGDKVSSYPILQQAVKQVLGCRLHYNTHDCTHWVCQDLQMCQVCKQLYPTLDNGRCKHCCPAKEQPT
jgi:hypothetical protein